MSRIIFFTLLFLQLATLLYSQDYIPIQSRIYQSWDDPSQNWTNDRRIEYKTQIEDSLYVTMYQTWDNALNKWVSTSMDSTLYLDQGDQRVFYYNEWNNNSFSWEPNRKAVTSYSYDGISFEYLNYEWNKIHKKWDIIEIGKSEYNSQNQLVSRVSEVWNIYPASKKSYSEYHVYFEGGINKGYSTSYIDYETKSSYQFRLVNDENGCQISEAGYYIDGRDPSFNSFDSTAIVHYSDNCNDFEHVRFRKQSLNAEYQYQSTTKQVRKFTYSGRPVLEINGYSEDSGATWNNWTEITYEYDLINNREFKTTIDTTSGRINKDTTLYTVNNQVESRRSWLHNPEESYNILLSVYKQAFNENGESVYELTQQGRVHNSDIWQYSREVRYKYDNQDRLIRQSALERNYDPAPQSPILTYEAENIREISYFQNKEPEITSWVTKYNLPPKPTEGYRTINQFKSTVQSGLLEEDPWHIFPNPASDQIFIFAKPDIKNTSTIDLFRVDGTPVKEWNIFFTGNQKTLSVKEVPNGIYMLRYPYQGKFYLKKILIVH